MHRSLTLPVLGTLLVLAGPARADNAIAVTKPAFGLVDGVLFAGEGTGRVDGTGTLIVFSQAGPDGAAYTPPVACRGTFQHDFKTGKGHLACDNGEEADFTFRFSALTQGVGEGASKDHGTIRFTFGFEADEAARPLRLPEGARIVAAGLARNGLPAYRLETPAPAGDGGALPGGATRPVPSLPASP